MDDHTLLIVPLIAVAAPILAALIGRVAMVPLVVFEIVLGIIAGPSVLGWLQPNEVISTLAQIGLALLFFVAGSEIDFAAIKGRPLIRAGLAWLITLVAALAAGIVFAPTFEAGVFIGVALASTALGAILPVLRDARELRTPLGRAITAIGAVGEFGPLLAISLFLSGRQLDISLLVVVVFAAVAGGAIWFAGRSAHPHTHALVRATLHSSGQFAVRLILFVVAALVVLSILLDLDMLLGAFAAGILWRVFSSGASHDDRKIIEAKVEAIAFGFLVPIFFIVTGMNFDLDALVSDPGTLLLVPLFLLLLLVLRGLPGLLVAPPGSTAADRRAVVLFGATSLPIIVAVTQIGQKEGFLTSGVATALVAAGMLSVLLFPLIALAQRRHHVVTQQRLFPADDAL